MKTPFILYTYSIPEDARYDADRLAKAHIESSVREDLSTSTAPSESGSLGRFKLLVDIADYPRALEVLSERYVAGEDDEIPEPVKEVERCPNCDAVYYAHKESALKGLAYLLCTIGIFAIPSDKKRCSECGHKW